MTGDRTAARVAAECPAAVCHITRIANYRAQLARTCCSQALSDRLHSAVNGSAKVDLGLKCGGGGAALLLRARARDLTAEVEELDVTRGDAAGRGGVAGSVAAGLVLAAGAFELGALFAVDGQVAVLHDGAFGGAVGHFLVLNNRRQACDCCWCTGRWRVRRDAPDQAASLQSNQIHPCSPRRRCCKGHPSTSLGRRRRQWSRRSTIPTMTRWG